jgi:hypothetical protein
MIGSLPPGTTKNCDSTGAESGPDQVPGPIRGETGPGYHRSLQVGPIFDFPLFYGHILQVQDPHRPSHQVRPATGAIEKGEPGPLPEDRKRYAGQPDPGPEVQHLIGNGIKSGGEQDRVSEMPIVKTVGLSGPQTPGDDSLIGQPSLIAVETVESRGIQLETNRLGTSHPDLTMFHVKQTLNRAAV